MGNIASRFRSILRPLTLEIAAGLVFMTVVVKIWSNDKYLLYFNMGKTVAVFRTFPGRGGTDSPILCNISGTEGIS